MIFRAASRQSLGHQAETLVDRKARGRGWRCVARNYNVRGGELDLVYRSRQNLIVVEVRYRSRDDYGGALASVTPSKQRRIIHATKYLLAERPDYADLAIRFDVVGVNGEGQLDWVENAFYAE